MTQFQPRYVAYATANGRAAFEQLEHDKVEFPGGCMAGFILWISDMWTAWYASHGRKKPGPSCAPDVLTNEDHASFDRFIGAQLGAFQ